jgi:hypothetical protein
VSFSLFASVLLQSAAFPDPQLSSAPPEAEDRECCDAGAVAHDPASPAIAATLPTEPTDARPAAQWTQVAPRFAHANLADPTGDEPAAGTEAASEDPLADKPAGTNDPYSFRLFRKQAGDIGWRFGGAAAAISIGGFTKWNWGNSSFRFNSEGWFGKDTASMGMDKLGHAYSAYVLTEFFSDGLEKKYPGDRSGLYTSAILSMGLMTYIEVFDGFSGDHGFSYEDLVVDAAGALFSVARRSVPGLRDKIDFRLLYVPSKSTWRALSCFPEPHCDRNGGTVRGPFTDYSHQRYLLALKLSGFDKLERTPLRLLELHGGYYARGFTREEKDRGDPLRRRLFVGVGLNVGELLFPGRRRGIPGLAKWALQYLQVPYTAVHSN